MSLVLLGEGDPNAIQTVLEMAAADSSIQTAIERAAANDPLRMAVKFLQNAAARFDWRPRQQA
jgi:hypothetical protein